MQTQFAADRGLRNRWYCFNVENKLIQNHYRYQRGDQSKQANTLATESRLTTFKPLRKLRQREQKREIGIKEKNPQRVIDNTI